MAVQDTTLAVNSTTPVAVQRNDEHGTPGWSLTVQNTQAVNLYFGGSGVSTSSPYLAPGIIGSWDLQGTGEVMYFLLASGSGTVPILTTGV